MWSGRTTVLLCCAIMLCMGAIAQESFHKEEKPTFTIGTEVQQYPDVQWIKGEQVNRFDSNKIYIVECWATWCIPCKAAIPHLNKLYKEFGDRIVFIGQNIWETGKEKVEDFVQKMGDGMSYNIAFGGGKESDFSIRWMQAAGVEGIPKTFVIQNNKVVWMPNPSELSEQTLQLLIDRKFTIDAARALDPNKKYAAVTSLLMNRKYDQAMIKLDSVMQKYPSDEEGVVISGVALKYVLYTNMGKNDEAMAYIKNAYKDNPTSNVTYMYFKALQDNKKWDELAGEAEAYLKKNTKDDWDAAEVMVFWYKVLNAKGDNDATAALINKFTASTNNAETLKMLALLNRNTTLEKPNTRVSTAMYNAGLKSLSISPADIELIGELVKIDWKNNDKAGAKKLTSKMIAVIKKQQDQQAMVSILKKLFSSLNKNVLPPDVVFKNWKEEANK